MNERERRICSRLKEFRERLGHSQRVFAVAVGISRDQLASIEYGRTPLQGDIAIRVANLTGCNLNWLAEGTGPLYGPLPNRDFMVNMVPWGLFSQAWDAWFKRGLGPNAKQFGEHKGTGDVVGGASAQSYLDEEMSGVTKLLPRQLHSNFFSHMTEAARDFVAMNQAMITEMNASRKNQPKKSLTGISLKSKERGVKSEIQKLIEQVKRAASKPGAKVALARALDVAPARISEWLSGEKEPGGEYTLRLLRWVEQQERHKK